MSTASPPAKKRSVFTITFSIDGQDYRIIPIPVEAGQKAYRFKKGDVTYDVLLNEEGVYSCECKGFLRYGMCKDGRGCRHIRTLVAAGMIQAPPTAKPAAE
jgi:hypothetical protein